jgi:hypothetical protein
LPPKYSAFCEMVRCSPVGYARCRFACLLPFLVHGCPGASLGFALRDTAVLITFLNVFGRAGVRPELDAPDRILNPRSVSIASIAFV